MSSDKHHHLHECQAPIVEMNASEAEVVPSRAPTGDEPVWTSQRIELKKWLESTAPALAPLYAGAVNMVCDDSFPGRVVFVAHAVREIRNRLPEALAGEVDRLQTQYSQLADQIAQAWVDDGYPPDGSHSVELTSDPELSGPRRYEISEALFTAVAGLISEHGAGSMRYRDKARLLLESQTDWPIPAYVIEIWLDASEWVRKFAHVGDQPLRVSDESELVGRFEKFETVLMVIARRSYENMDELDELLDSANR